MALDKVQRRLVRHKVARGTPRFEHSLQCAAYAQHRRGRQHLVDAGTEFKTHSARRSAYWQFTILFIGKNHPVGMVFVDIVARSLSGQGPPCQVDGSERIARGGHDASAGLEEVVVATVLGVFHVRVTLHNSKCVAVYHIANIQHNMGKIQVQLR